ncbi:MAG: glycosyltransferase [Alteraurantiacibacter sp.]
MSEQLDFSGLRVLLAAHSLRGFTGSEVHLFELATYFSSAGAEVTCLALEVGDPMATQLAERGVNLVSKWQLIRRPRDYDIVWSHHETTFLLLHVALGVSARRHLHGLLSWQHKIEGVPRIPLEPRNANLRIIANSAETRDAAMRLSGRDDIEVMPNFVPQAFSDTVRGTLPDQLTRVAVVSNHVPDEVLHAVKLLRDQSIELTIFGRGHCYTRLDETTLAGFDAVITIGKTVQYCITQGIPVFIYDRFGGPGYIHARDFGHHLAQNFSGRSDPRKRAGTQLAHEVVAGYPAARGQADNLRRVYAPVFAIEHCVRHAIGNPDDKVRPALTTPERLATLGRQLLRHPQAILRVLAPDAVARLSALYDEIRKGRV